MESLNVKVAGRNTECFENTVRLGSFFFPELVAEFVR